MIDYSDMIAMNAVDKRTYLELYKYHNLSASSDYLGFMGVVLDKGNKKNNVLTYRAPIIVGQESQALSESLAKPLETRCRSSRAFNARLGKHELIELLIMSFGETSKEDRPYRPYPSGGALYPVNVFGYLKEQNESFSFNPINKKITVIKEGINNDIICSHLRISGNQQLEGFSAVLLYSFAPIPAIAKYKYRGYRNALLECGSMYQTLSLVAAQKGFREIVYSGFDEVALSVALGVDPKHYWPIVSHILGK